MDKKKYCVSSRRLVTKSQLEGKKQNAVVLFLSSLLGQLQISALSRTLLNYPPDSRDFPPPPPEFLRLVRDRAEIKAQILLYQASQGIGSGFFFSRNITR